MATERCSGQQTVLQEPALVVPASRIEESEVRELSVKESGISSGTPFLRGLHKYLQPKGGFRSQFRTPSPKVRKPHFRRFGFPELFLMLVEDGHIQMLHPQDLSG